MKMDWPDLGYILKAEQPGFQESGLQYAPQIIYFSLSVLDSNIYSHLVSSSSLLIQLHQNYANRFTRLLS